MIKFVDQDPFERWHADDNEHELPANGLDERNGLPPIYSDLEHIPLLEDDDGGDSDISYPVESSEWILTRIRDIAARPSGIKGQLDLSGLGLSQLPEELLPELRQFTSIDLSGNNLTSLPDAIGTLRKLTSLDLRDNALRDLPGSLASLPSLRRLYLGSNAMRTVPSCIMRIDLLEQLDLSAMSLQDLPSGFGRLESLQLLDVSYNQFNEIPVSILEARQLKVLSLEGNNVGTLAPILGELTNLISLNANMTSLMEISSDIRNLAMLQTLELSENMIIAIPAEISELNDLRSLVLNANEITEVPREIAKLKNLALLSLDGNDISNLPREMGSMPQILDLRLADNPLVEPLPSMVADWRYLRNYLASLEVTFAQYEARLLLVGEGGVGKSSLVAALRGDEFVANRATTHGIELDGLLVPQTDDSLPAIQLNTWDFGGQEVYRITHQFFFSRRSLYLVVWKPREGQDQNSIEEWCSRIRLRVGDGARIIVVATHSAERRPEFDYEALQRKFPGIIAGNVCVDSETGEGIESLRELIQLEASLLPQMGEKISQRWRAARDEIISLDTPQISRLHLERICAEHGLDEISTETFTRLLHDLGYVIFYGDDDGLREMVVLQPEWLTKAIGYVLEDAETRAQGGVLMHARLEVIWGDGGLGTGYPTEIHPYFLRLMEKFDVSFRLPDEAASLVAQLVPYSRPDDWRTRGLPLPAGTRRLRMVCRTAEDAPGLIAWLTVRNHRFSVGCHWRRGVLLTHPTYGSQAVLELSQNNRDLILTVLGPSPDYFFHILRDSVEELISRRWSGLQYQFLVPCGVQIAKNRFCTGYFSYRTLRKFRERDESRIICNVCAEWSDVGSLLTGFSLSSRPVEQLLLEIRAAQSETNRGVRALEATSAQIANHLRVALRLLSAEVSDCPRLFTLVPSDRNAVVRTISLKRSFTLTLWCEEPGCEHELDAATYLFRPPKAWVSLVGPYVKFVTRTLSVVVPILAGAYAVSLAETDLASVREKLELMTTLSEKFPEVVDIPEEGTGEFQSGLSRAEGAGLRSLRALLSTLDPASQYGGLRMVRSASGDTLWICGHHYRSYDPGLPDLGYGR